ncbi:hypothetical protein NPIL_447271 [Nephila pilipes]|uniref:Uncharacterized protein n=1 Tax=Nephila pilipes TaxID=299642 RepID=A0A8X6P9F5_NEPPI|nr:hypothetical protein NPIL_447271 [Nephila pilipes]
MFLALDLDVQFDGFESRCNFTAKKKFRPREKSSIPTVQSLIILSMCESFDLEAQLLSRPGRNYVDSKQNRKAKPPPVVRSFMVYKMCLTLDISVKPDTEMQFD